jgi:dihydroxy-acid dehydratase
LDVLEWFIYFCVAVLELGNLVKKTLENDNMIAWQYNTIGVSDGITMGHEGKFPQYTVKMSEVIVQMLTEIGMRFSLQSREIIADSIETMTCAQYHDACIAIPGCDKNMPGVVMAFARHNRPSIMIYGGTIMQGHSKTLRKPINITTCFEVHGAYTYKTLKSDHDPTIDMEDIMTDVERHACPGVGACGGMYTANTMACCIEGK